MTATSRPEMSINFAAHDVNVNPFPVLAAVREEAPAVFNPLIQHWMVGRYSDIRTLLADDVDFATDAKFFDDMFGARTFIADDNPRHNETRSIWNASFQRGNIADRRELVERVVEDCLTDMLVSMRAGKTVEAMSRFANRIPSLVISEMLGVERQDIPSFGHWSEDMNLIAESVVEVSVERAEQLRATGQKAQLAMCAYAGKQLERRRREERDDDLIGLLALSPIAEERSEDELRAGVAQLVLAGHETTGKLIGHMLITFGRHRDQFEAIREDRGLIPQAIEELIRFAGVIGAIVRSARVDTEIQGIPIPAGDLILNLPTTANRDPRRWEDPDRFDIFRERQAHIGFGFGTHSCIGLNLARFEATVALEKLLTMAPEYQLAQDEFDYGTNWFLRGPRQVHISL